MKATKTIIIILVALLIIGLFVHYKNKPDASNHSEVENWKTYSNQQYGIEIQYPYDWIVDTSGRIVDIIQFCPKELTDSDTTCKIVNNPAGLPQPQAPIIYTFFEKNGRLQLTSNDSKYVQIYDQMASRIIIN